MTIYNSNSPINTPHIDKLGREGVAFTHGFVTNPICAASRASIVTGRYNTNAGGFKFRVPLEEEVFQLTYPLVLQEHGYFVGQLGKYGVGITREQRQVFDVFDATEGQGPAFREYQGEQVHDSEWLTLRTEAFLDAVPDGTPFALQINYKAPHPTSEVAPEDRGKLSHVSFDRALLETPEANAKYFRWLNWDMGTLEEELYRLDEDPEETTNLATEPEYQGKMEWLRSRFLEWREANPVNYELASYGPRPQFGATEIDWDRFREVRPEEFKRIEAEVKRLGVTWDQAVNDWDIRFQICSRAGYWY